jgi:glucose 1-dehydrogenase
MLQLANLGGKVALITGASRGIGRGIALAMADAGADIAILYRTHADDANEVSQQIREQGRRALSIRVDVADRPALERAFSQTVGEFGHIDIVVANAALERAGSILELPWEDARRTFEVTQFGVYHTCQFAAQRMVRQIEAGRPGGKIILIGSVHAEMAVAGDAPYNMAKAAVEQLGRTLAIELAPHRINVNTIHPGWIDTPGEREMFGDAAVDAGGERIPWGRLGTPQDVARLAVFLAGEGGDYITGSILRIDGGFMVGLKGV